MKFFEKIKLAFYNLIKRRKTTAQCVIMMSFIMLIVFISAFFITTLVAGLSDNLDNYASKNYITIRHWDDEDMPVDNILLNPNMQATLKSKFNSIGDISYYKEAVNFYIFSISNLIVDGETFPFDDSFSENFWAQIIIKEISAPTFSAKMQTEFSKKFPGQSLIKYGRDIVNAGEILFPEEFLILYGITAEELLLADKVALNFLYIDNEIEIDELFFYDAKVVGITNANIPMMYPDKDGKRDPTEYSTFYAESGVLFFDAYIYIYQRIDLNDSSEINEILEYIRVLFGDGYSIQYANQGKLNELNTINKILTFVTDIIIVLIFVLGVALIVFLYSIMEYNAKQKGPYFGIMRAMGKSGTFDIILIETIIMTIFASIISLALSILIVHLLNGAVISISWFSRYIIIVDIGIFAIVFSLTLVTVILLNIILAYLSSRRQNSKTIIEALRS